MAVPLRHAPTSMGLTDRELALLPFPELPGRLSQRQPASRTKAAHPRTFQELREWSNYSNDAVQLVLQLDQVSSRNANPYFFISDDGLAPASNEVAVHGAMDQLLFPQVNKIARRLGFKFQFRCGGSGRALSCTDMVVLDTSQTQDMGDLARRVYANGEAKGPWQWAVTGSSFIEEVQTKGQKSCIEQLFGDMVMDEARYGFLTNFNQTFFFRRGLSNTKCLDVSPLVSMDSAPVAHFLYFLQAVELDRGSKSAMDRLAVQETPPRGYRLQLPDPAQSTRSAGTMKLRKRSAASINVQARAGKRQRVRRTYDVEDFEIIPAIPMADLGITGAAVGLGKYGNVLQASIHGRKVALKCFDMRHQMAAESFVQEQKVYEKLKPLQGTVVPELLAIGRLPHCCVYYLALTDEGNISALDCGDSDVVPCIWVGLHRIHEQGIVHGDLSRSHILWNPSGQVKFIDFDKAKLAATQEDQEDEVEDMKELLQVQEQQRA